MTETHTHTDTHTDTHDGTEVEARPGVGEGSGSHTIEDPHASHEHEHPRDREYITIALILGVITAAEVATYYFDLGTGFLLALLIPMMIAKFAIVAMFFMHLRYDSKVFTAAFVFGIMLAAGVYIVALATFKFFG